MNTGKKAKLILADGSEFSGYSFGYEKPVTGELVFNTAMTGYTESLTDPSYKGQILTTTYPLTGNYGIPGASLENDVHEFFESDKIQVTALITNNYSFKYSHWNAEKSLSKWLISQEIPALTGIDTRQLTIKLREHGTMIAKIEFEDQPSIEFADPNLLNLVEQVSITETKIYGEGKYKVLLIDCGVKNNIIRNLLKRDTQITRVPYNKRFNPLEYDGIFISNGPGDPEKNVETIKYINEAYNYSVPIMGICLGCQIMALASGSKTYKLKYGHRGHNQPVIQNGTDKCYITSQNHGYAIENDSIASDWEMMFYNANDRTCEGIKHKSKPFFASQFHPEANGGPTDTEFLFDYFIDSIKNNTK